MRSFGGMRLCLVIWLALGFLPTLALAQEAGGAPVVSWQDAKAYLGRDVEVVGKVVRCSKSSQGNVFLNFTEDWKGTVSIYIPKQAVGQFPQSPDELFRGKMIQVRGQLKDYRGSPSLTITGPANVKVLPDDAPLPGKSTASRPSVGGVAPASAPAAGARAGEPTIRTDEYLPVVPWNKAGDFLDQEVFVVGKVVRARPLPGGPTFLNFSEDFQNTLGIHIRKDTVARFPQPPDKMYLDKMVKVRGRLTLFKGKPSLTLSGPESAEILPDGFAVPAEPILPSKVKSPMSVVPGSEITIGTYNVMNLFDSYDDPYSDDTVDDAKPRTQLTALAKSIRSLDADVLALEEVENRGILETFVRAFLADLGYEVVLIEGNDSRGIDVALLSRLPVGPVTTHRHLQFKDDKGNLVRFRRDLLEVRINPPGGTPFDVFVVHLKSKGGDENGSLDVRLAEAREVRMILDDVLKRDPGASFVLCGDFNDTIDSPPLKAIVGSGPTQLAGSYKDVPADEQVTFNQEPFRAMIDFVLASPAMAKRYVSKSYRIFVDGSPALTGSDHNPVTARFLTR